MTDEEATLAFKTALGEASRKCDAEGLHGIGDDFVANILKAHGFPKLARAYEKECADWWYA